MQGPMNSIGDESELTSYQVSTHLIRDNWNLSSWNSADLSNMLSSPSFLLPSPTHPIRSKRPLASDFDHDGLPEVSPSLELPSQVESSCKYWEDPFFSDPFDDSSHWTPPFPLPLDPLATDPPSPCTESVIQTPKLCSFETSPPHSPSLPPSTPPSLAMSCADDALDSPSPMSEYNVPLYSVKPSNPINSLFYQLTQTGIDWCRYCGTTETVSWRPGPWGKRTLCNKHGCDYKGYGMTRRQPRLDLSNFLSETIHHRLNPVFQEFCVVCQEPETDSESNPLLKCSSCPQAYHMRCCPQEILALNATTDLDSDESSGYWFCSSVCPTNLETRKVVFKLDGKNLPLKIPLEAVPKTETSPPPPPKRRMLDRRARKVSN